MLCALYMKNFVNTAIKLRENEFKFEVESKSNYQTVLFVPVMEAPWVFEAFLCSMNSCEILYLKLAVPSSPFHLSDYLYCFSFSQLVSKRLLPVAYPYIYFYSCYCGRLKDYDCRWSSEIIEDLHSWSLSQSKRLKMPLMHFRTPIFMADIW